MQVKYLMDYNIVIILLYLYHAIEKAANQNAGNLLYICQYSTKPSHRSVRQFNCITPNFLIWLLYFLWHGIKKLCNSFSWYNCGMSHFSLGIHTRLKYTTRKCCITSRCSISTILYLYFVLYIVYCICILFSSFSSWAYFMKYAIIQLSF